MIGMLVAPFVAYKIHRYGFALVGFAGLADVIKSRIPVTMSDPLRDLPAVIRDAPGDGYTALLCEDGALYQISEDGGTHQVSSEYWAVGSGAEAALGYLAGWRSHLKQGEPVTPFDAVGAIQFASTLDAGVGFETQVERL